MGRDQGEGEETMSSHSSSGRSTQARDRAEQGRHDTVRMTARPARVIVTPVESPFYHPLTKRDVQRVLSVLPPESTEGLRSVSLLSEMSTAEGYPVLVSYRRQGFIRLHAVPRTPWRTGPLNAPQVADLLRYGAHVDANPHETHITWTPDALRLFYTVSVLMPGVSRHRREREGLTESNSIVRALDETTDPWLVSDLALSQWGNFMSEVPGEASARA